MISSLSLSVCLIDHLINHVFFLLEIISLKKKKRLDHEGCIGECLSMVFI